MKLIDAVGTRKRALAQLVLPQIPFASVPPVLDLANLPDADVVALAQEGREPAYRELLRRYERPVFSLIFRMVRDRETAEDLAQETFIKVLNHIDRYRPEFKLSSWLFKIANNVAIDHLRKRHGRDDQHRRLAARGDPSRDRGHLVRRRIPRRIRPRGGRVAGAGDGDRARDRPASSGVPIVHHAPSRRGPVVRGDRGHAGPAPRDGEDVHPPSPKGAQGRFGTSSDVAETPFVRPT